MFTGTAVENSLAQLGVTDVVWLPDSVMGPWEEALAASQRIALRRVCREGEAWALAGGLWLGGRQPLVMIQSTGLFESGDALRNMLFDFRLPLYAMIGYRSYLTADSRDTAKQFLEPVLAAWGVDWVLLKEANDLERFSEHYLASRAAQRPGMALLAEGAM